MEEKEMWERRTNRKKSKSRGVLYTLSASRLLLSFISAPHITFSFNVRSQLLTVDAWNFVPPDRLKRRQVLAVTSQ